MGNRRVRSLSGMGGSKGGRGISWYSGRGGRLEDSPMADVVAIWLILLRGQRNYCRFGTRRVSGLCGQELKEARRVVIEALMQLSIFKAVLMIAPTVDW